MVCPVCEKNDARSRDWCPSCGAYLGLLTRRPRHIGTCIRVSIFVGVGLFLGLAWQIFMPLTEGWPVGRPTRMFWLGFALATFFLTLGLTARQHLVAFLHRQPEKEAPGRGALAAKTPDAPGPPSPR